MAVVKPAHVTVSAASLPQTMRHELVQAFLRRHASPLVFVTVSGAHLYGFDSPNSDYDLRGSHVTPLRQWCRLAKPSETYEVMDRDAPVEMDVVTHDVEKFCRLLLKNNGYVLEQLCSRIVVVTCDEHAEMKAIARYCITRNHRFHYAGFAHNQWQAVVKGGKPTVKGLLYTYRVLLAGIHLMRTGEVEPDLRVLQKGFDLPFLPELIALKASGDEKQELKGHDLDRHEREYLKLQQVLDDARSTSRLPEEPDPVKGRAALDDLLVRIRMQTA